MASTITAFAPGRVNLIGEHTDYNGGLSLPFAIAGGITVKAIAVPGDRIEADACDLGESDSFSVHAAERQPGWRAFVRGTVAELVDSGVRLGGTQLEISGNLSPGGGLSSSAALGVSLALALSALAGHTEPDRIELAKLCSRVENGWVGARTGLLDQLASLFGEQGCAVRIDFRSLAIERVPLEIGDCRFVLLDSGERHANAGSGYNRRREECARAAQLLGIDTLREADPDGVERLPSPLADRARHVLSENARVIKAVEALRAGDPAVLGQLLNDSHESLRDRFEVSTAAVERARARLLEVGAVGARLVGGGFGGNVLGLMPPRGDLPKGAREITAGPGAALCD